MFDRLLINANIYTLDADHPHGTVIALYQDRIVAIGGDELRTRASAGVQIDNLDGATVLPGLTDAHIHWQWTSQALHEIDLFDVPSKAEALRRLERAVQHAKPNTWLIGQGWAQAAWPEDDGAYPTAADLDPVCPNNPVMLKARSGHGIWVNTLALQQAHITDSTPDPEGGIIQRDRNGHATGILLENASNFVSQLVPELTPNELADLMEQAQTTAWQMGLTGIHDFDGPEAFEAFQILHEQNRLGLRVVKNINAPYIAHALALRLRWGFGDHWLRLGGLKIFADGALGTRTALMIEPYDGEPANYGVVVTDKEEIFDLVNIASRSGFPSTIHAIGDKAVHDVLDVYEAVRREEAALGLPRSARRHRIEHVQLIHPADAGRLAELDIIASMQPIHATADYQMADRYWGSRAQWGYNPRLQLQAGARVAFGSDSPIEPFNPFKGIHAAVTRRRADGSPGEQGWYPDAKLSVDEAIHGYTQGPAYATGMEKHLGKLAPNYLADLIVLDRDPYTIPPDDLVKVQVIGTLVGGVWKYSRLE